MSDIQSVRRAFDILKAVSSNAGGASLTEIAARVELPKSTVSRMLSTLAGVGAVERMSEREGFRIGNELIAIASNVTYPRTLSAIAKPFLQQLSQTSGETATLCMPDGDLAHYVDQVNSSRVLQVHNWVGQKLPVHACSDGKLYLANWSDDEVERYVRRPLQRFTRSTLTTPTAVRKEIRNIRRKGYAWTNGEFDADIVGVSAPIRDELGQVVASICLFGAAFRWPGEMKAGRLIDMTSETADKISSRMRVAHSSRTTTALASPMPALHPSKSDSKSV